MADVIMNLRVGNNQIDGALIKIQTNLSNVHNASAKFENSMSNAINGIQQKVNSFANNNLSKINDVAAQIPLLSNLFGLVSNPYIAIGAGITAIGAAVVKATQFTSQWQTKMAEVNVTAQLSAQELTQLSNKIASIGTKAFVPIEQAPDAFNRIISAGLDANQALSALEPTLAAAKAGFTDLETTAAAGVGVMKSAGIDDITQVYDTLFATVIKGNVKFKDIANYLPKILPLAKAAGFELQDMAAAYAQLTAQGQSAEQSATGLQNLAKALGDIDVIKGTSSKKGLAGVGIDVYDANNQKKSLFEIVNQIQAKIATLHSQEQKDLFFNDIGLDTEAATALGGLTNNIKDYQNVLSFVQQSQGQLNKALQNSMSISDRITKTWNLLKWAALKIGNAALPIVQHAFDGINIAMDMAINTATQLSSFYQNNLAASIQKVITPIAPLMHAVVALASTIIGKIAQNLQIVIPIVAGVVATLIQKVSNGIAAILQIVQPPITAFFNAINTGIQNMPTIPDIIAKNIDIIAVAAAAGAISYAAWNLQATIAATYGATAFIQKLVIMTPFLAAATINIAKNAIATAALNVQNTIAAIKTTAYNMAILVQNPLQAVALIRTTALAIATRAASIATAIFTTGQWALNAALTANPVGVVVIALAALGTGLYIAYTRSDKFRAAIAGIAEVLKAVYPVFKASAEVIAGMFTFNPSLIKQGVSNMAAAVKDIANKGIANIFDKGYNQSIAKNTTPALSTNDQALEFYSIKNAPQLTSTSIPQLPNIQSTIKLPITPNINPHSNSNPIANKANQINKKTTLPAIPSNTKLPITPNINPHSNSNPIAQKVIEINKKGLQVIDQMPSADNNTITNTKNTTVNNQNNTSTNQNTQAPNINMNNTFVFNVASQTTDATVKEFRKKLQQVLQEEVAQFSVIK